MSVLNETSEKRVHFTSDDDYLEPNINDLSHEEDDTPLLKSPLKATTGLGSTIKKLSPVSGAAQTDEAKRAYNRLLQQAAMSMFSNDDGDNELAGIGKENKTNASEETPDFYKVAAEIATPNSHAINRLESQQYDLSPPMPRGLAPPSGKGDAPTTPISSSHRDFLAYREAHSAARSGDIHKQMQGLRQDFLHAQQGSLSPDGAQQDLERASKAGTEAKDELNIDDDFDSYTGISTESSSAAVAILNAHLNSIHFDEAEPGESLVDQPDSDSGHFDIPKKSEFHDFDNSTINRKFDFQKASGFSEEENGNVAFEICTEKQTLTAKPEHSDSNATSDPHPANCEEAFIVAECIDPAQNGQLIGLSIQEGEELLKRSKKFLSGLDIDLSPRFSSLSTFESSSIPTTVARAMSLQTYSMDDLEASVLLKHEQLLSQGIIMS